MPDIAEILRTGGNGWIYLPLAILLGALHGFEPGHSKTMMAAYIVAIRGTVGQAVLLGVCAALSHSVVVWAVALVGLSLGREVVTEQFEGWLLVVSGVIILSVAFWMLWRTGQNLGWFHRHPHHGHRYHGHSHGPGEHHHHHDEVRTIDTGHGVVELSVFDDGVPPHWRVRTLSGASWDAQSVAVETERPDGMRQGFTFVERDGYLESVNEIPEPHEFKARVRLSHGNHAHVYEVVFSEHAHGHSYEHAHGHHHHHHDHHGEDAHEREHAEQIARQFAVSGTQVTTSQIALFGITGGLIPCPASITVLLICLQLGQFSLGVATVAAFSLGLAITMVTIGVAAAWGMHHASQRLNLSDRLLRVLPLGSVALVALIGFIMLWDGLGDLQPLGA